MARRRAFIRIGRHAVVNLHAIEHVVHYGDRLYRVRLLYREPDSLVRAAVHSPGQQNVGCWDQAQHILIPRPRSLSFISTTLDKSACFRSQSAISSSVEAPRIRWSRSSSVTLISSKNKMLRPRPNSV